MEETKKYKYELPKDFTVKWLKALRSGKYKQNHRGFLCDEDLNFCCIGVACAIQGHSIKKMSQSGYGMPYDVFKRLRIPKDLGRGGLFDELSEMNDGTFDYRNNPQTFNQISDWIDKNVKQV